MDTDLEALATALHVTVDDLLIAHPPPGPTQTTSGPEPTHQWRRDHHPGTHADPTGPHQPAALTAPRPQAPDRHVPPHPGPIGVQQAPARPHHHVLAHHHPGTIHQGMGPLPVSGRLHPHRVRPLPPHRQAIRAGRVGRLRILRLPLPLLVGPCTCTWSPRPTAYQRPEP